MNFRQLDNAAKHLEQVIAVAETRLRTASGRVPEPDEILEEPDVVAAMANLKAIGVALADGRRAWRIKQMFERVDWDSEMERPQ